MNRSLVKQQHIPRLSRQELRTVRQTWPCFKLKQSDLVWLRKYKQDHGFDPYFLGEYQIYKVFEKTNLPLRLSALENKALFDIYLSKLPFPQTYIRCISNVFYDSAMAVISIDKAVDVLTNVKEFIIKPACETSQGKGMKKICTIDYDKDKLLDLLSSYRDSYARIGGGYIVQAVVNQHDEIEKLNPSSLNTCRVTTIYMNGKFSYSAILKVGKIGAVKDNWNSSYLIGMANDGTLRDYGYDNKLNKVETTDNGIRFGGMKVPAFSKMVEFTKEYHVKYFPNCGVVGWDIYIDKNDNIGLVEVNLTNIGVTGEQLCSGTFFKPFHDDICSMLSR